MKLGQQLVEGSFDLEQLTGSVATPLSRTALPAALPKVLATENVFAVAAVTVTVAPFRNVDVESWERLTGSLTVGGGTEVLKVVPVGVMV